ncbi:hypothetical protein E3C22_20655 [Jiella endophytica]|uniref:Uncharacterized protein n=1 Tax=Jiella endophytica TaxID=2558362 RepID=A0A4Y8RDU8_9HYPH|nr:hypothetical protein [Jiella endophytica]TFF19177.1 hypothetical protein E3C22_20655 [Jiella endophytica]
MALRGYGDVQSGERAAWSWVDAPDVLEDEGLLHRLRANNDALESLRQALDDEGQVFARFIRRDPEASVTEEPEPVGF